MNYSFDSKSIIKTCFNSIFYILNYFSSQHRHFTHSHKIGNNVHEHKGQKEVVLSRPSTSFRHQYSDSVLEALSRSAATIQNNDKVNENN